MQAAFVAGLDILIELVEPPDDEAKPSHAEAHIELAKESHPCVFLARLCAAIRLSHPLYGENTGFLRPAFDGSGKRQPVAWVVHRFAQVGNDIRDLVENGCDLQLDIGVIGIARLDGCLCVRVVAKPRDLLRPRQLLAVSVEELGDAGAHMRPRRCDDLTVTPHAFRKIVQRLEFVAYGLVSRNVR